MGLKSKGQGSEGSNLGGLNLEELRKGTGRELADGRAYLVAHDDMPSFVCAREDVAAIARWLRDECSPRYVQLSSITATDESLADESEPDRVVLRRGAQARFRVVYHFAAIPGDGRRAAVRLIAWAEDGEPVPSITGLWSGANWMEREVYDMFGIPFEGHPDLKRILMPDGYDGHPLRKEFPLRGTAPDRLYRQWDQERRT